LGDDVENVSDVQVTLTTLGGLSGLLGGLLSSGLGGVSELLLLLSLSLKTNESIKVLLDLRLGGGLSGCAELGEQVLTLLLLDLHKFIPATLLGLSFSLSGGSGSSGGGSFSSGDLSGGRLTGSGLL